MPSSMTERDKPATASSAPEASPLVSSGRMDDDPQSKNSHAGAAGPGGSGMTATGLKVLALLAVQNSSKNLLLRFVMKEHPKFLKSAAILGVETVKLGASSVGSPVDDASCSVPVPCRRSPPKLLSPVAPLHRPRRAPISRERGDVHEARQTKRKSGRGSGSGLGMTSLCLNFFCVFLRLGFFRPFSWPFRPRCTAFK